MKLRNIKTGEIGEPRVAYQEIYVDTTEHKTYCYKTIAGFNEEWEDYRPPEPLIKDEKIRKAVRAWAEACGAKQIKYSVAPNQYYDADMGTGFSIKFMTKPVEVYLEDGKTYTLEELCGEEDICES